MKFVVFGDMCLDNISENDEIKISTELNKVKKENILIANLECPITNSRDKLNKDGPNLSTDFDKGKKLIAKLPIDLYTLANNHILDYGKSGFKDTITVLENTSKNYCGAGLNINDADNAFLYQNNDEKVAIVNVAESEYCLANDYGFGASSLDALKLLKRIKELKNKNFICIVIVHGGNEHYKYPSPRFKSLMHFIIDCGGDVVITHHTHNASGYEFYEGKPIFYSLGNFIFKRNSMPDYWYNGHAVEINTKNLKDFTIHPYIQGKNDNIFEFLDKEKKQKYIHELNKISEIITNDALLKKEWDSYIERKSYSYLSWIYGLTKVERIFFKVTGISRMNFLSKQKKLMINNLIQCESHHDLLLDVLRKNHAK
ncbi:CapA family protein [Photobacterium leiognathi]|uniref:CapA family protein n=1 Tax=Photobacterium leiognathi TaxID=553611 RepID=UPI002735F985|nr:CapA family protein [Photobacterium leiognathi]